MGKLNRLLLYHTLNAILIISNPMDSFSDDVYDIPALPVENSQM